MELLEFVNAQTITRPVVQEDYALDPRSHLPGGEAPRIVGRCVIATGASDDHCPSAMTRTPVRSERAIKPPATRARFRPLTWKSGP
jgi:hypothetical protein